MDTCCCQGDSFYTTSHEKIRISIVKMTVLVLFYGIENRSEIPGMEIGKWEDVPMDL